jgi:hypothetical protein
MNLTYKQVFARAVAAGVPIGARRFHDVFKANARLCPPIKFGSRTVEYAVESADALIEKLKRDAVNAGRKSVGLPPLNTAKSCLDKLPKRQRKAKR